MAKKKGKNPPGYPDLPPLPTVNFNTGVGGIRRDLKDARKEGKGAAGGQLGSISDKANKGINKQIAAADKRTARILQNIKRLEDQSRMFGREQRRGVEAERRHQLALGGAMSSGLVGSRARTTKTMTKATDEVVSAMGKQGEKMREAELGALHSSRRAEARADKASLSILDVLAAERRSDDVKYIQGLKHDEKMAELQHAQQLQLMQLGFEQDLYKMKMQTKTEKDFIKWQLEQGLMLTPEDQAALDWRFEKKRLSLPYRLEEQKAKRQQQEDQFHSFDVQMSAIEDGIQTATETWNSPGRRARAEAAFPNLPAKEAVAAYAAQLVGNSVPHDMEMSAINAAIRQTVDNIAGGGLAPTFTEVSALIEQTSPDMREYLASNPNLQTVHDTYRAIRTAQSPNGNSAFSAKASETNDDSFLDQALGVVGGGLGAAATFGLPAVLLKTAYSAGGSALGAAAANATVLEKLGAGGAQMSDDAVATVRNFLAKPGAFQNAVKSTLGRFGRLNPFGAVAGESGAVTASVLADLGLISAAGVVSHKLIDDAADAYQFAEAAEDENLQSTLNMMDAVAEAIIAGRRDPGDLDSIASSITSSGGAGNLWSSEIGWTSEQKQMVSDRLSVLKQYIERMKSAS